MKTARTSLLSLFLLLASCTSLPGTTTATPPTATSTTAPVPVSDPWQDRSVFQNGLISSQQATLSALPGASIYHLDLDIADDLFHVNGHEEVHYTNNEMAPLKEVEFRLYPNILGGEMTVSHVSADDKAVTPSYDLEDSLMILPLPTPLEPGQSTILKMNFAVTVPQEVELNYGVLAYYEDVLALGHSYPMIAVYDDEGWNAEIPPQSGDLTYGDAAFFLVKITAPQELTLVTTGSEVSRSQEGQRQTLTVASGPARDFYLAASPAYQELTKKVGETTIHSYAPQDADQGAQLALDVAAKAIDVYSRRYAPFPYTEFDIVSTPTLALGIEYPGMVAITSRIYDVNGDFNGTPVSTYMEATVAHEVGHQWFYNLIGDDQLDDPWLDESFAQFATLQYYEDEYGPQGAAGFRASLVGRWKSIDEAKIPVGLPVAKYSGQEYSAIVYGRGALFLEALKKEMGDSVFDAFMKDYAQQLSWGIATPEFFQSLAETHCSCDLDGLFNEWVY